MTKEMKDAAQKPLEETSLEQETLEQEPSVSKTSFSPEGEPSEQTQTTPPETENANSAEKTPVKIHESQHMEQLQTVPINFAASAADSENTVKEAQATPVSKPANAEESTHAAHSTHFAEQSPEAMAQMPTQEFDQNATASMENVNKEELQQNTEHASEHIQEQAQEQVQEQAPKQAQEQVQEQPPVMGFAGKAFAHMSKLAPIYLLLLFTAHVLGSIYLPSVYFPVEIAHVEIYKQMQSAEQWLIPPTSESLGSLLPGYYWFMALIDLIPMPDSIYLPVLSAAAAFIALCGMYALGLCTRLGAPMAFGGGLLLLSCPLFLIFMHMVGPEVLTTGLFTLAIAFLFRAWTKESAPFSFIFGFLFLALATLTGGFLPLWISLMASILLILWRGSLHRAHQLDAVIGFGVFVLSFALWLVLSILGSEHASALDAIMLQSISAFLPPYWPLPLPWALAFLACGLLPWILLPLFASWFRILGNSWTHLKASRKEQSGPTWLYFIAVIGMILVCLQKSDALFTALPLLPVFALILAKTACNLSRLGSNIYFLLLAVSLLICGVFITIISIPSAAPYWTPYIPEDMSIILGSLKGLPLLSAIFIITALLLVKFTQRAFAQGALMVMALFFVLVVQPMTFFVAPSLVGHAAMQHPMGAGLGTLPPSIAPHMPTHPVGHFPVAPIEGESIPENPEPTPVITAPEPTETTPTEEQNTNVPHTTPVETAPTEQVTPTAPVEEHTTPPASAEETAPAEPVAPSQEQPTETPATTDSTEPMPPTDL